MIKNVLAISASRYFMKRLFSISKYIINWQYDWLQDSIISNLVMYKAAMSLKELISECEDENFSIVEIYDKISHDWEQDWWKKLKYEMRSEILDLFIVENDEKYWIEI